MSKIRFVSILIGCGLGCAASANAQSFDASWNTIDGGGATFSTGASWSLGGTIAQPDASSFSPPLSGGTWELVGGFWPAARVSGQECIPCDANCDGSVNQFDIQPFIEVLSASSVGCSTCAADSNNDGSVNQFDIQGFVSCLVGP